MFPFARFEITGESMQPKFQSGDRVLVWRWGGIREGDTVVFSKNGMTMVKKAVKKNGDRWFVRGENISASTDSLDFGGVKERDMVGKVIATY